MNTTTLHTTPVPLPRIHDGCYVRLAVRGKRNITPVSSWYHRDMLGAVKALQVAMLRPQYAGRSLCLKEFYSSGRPTGRVYDLDDDGSVLYT